MGGVDGAIAWFIGRVCLYYTPCNGAACPVTSARSKGAQETFSALWLVLAMVNGAFFFFSIIIVFTAQLNW